MGATSPRAPLVDVAGAATMLGITVRHVRHLIAERRIPYVKVGHYVRFDPSELAAWIDERRVPEGGVARRVGR